MYDLDHEYWDGDCTVCGLPRRECQAKLDKDED